MLHASIQPYTLDFKFEAGTSRGVLTQKETYFLKIHHTENPDVVGIGEVNILKGLSIDDRPDLEQQLQNICNEFNKLELEVFVWNLNLIINQCVDDAFPSIRFAFETALYDLMNGGKRIAFDSDFVQNQQPILINGLVWMDKVEKMLTQIDEKIASGYTTIKLKIGAIDFDQELALLAHIRHSFSAQQITIRVDANGAFSPEEAPEKLQKLAQFNIHSIEQPIKQGQIAQMAELCQKTPLPIALDEELIGISDYFKKFQLLKTIRPQFVILKPALLGGFQHCREWIEIANRLEIDWWITSALESNIGLNAIAQFTATFNNPLPQGLGTGQLYHNNIESPLLIENGTLIYQKVQNWGL